ELLRDLDLGVCKAAVNCLVRIPPTPGIADLAWQHLHRADVFGCHATETLTTFVHHADRATAVRQLGVLAGDHGHGEELQAASVHHLTRLGAEEDLSQLVGLLLEPPAVRWALHLALLEAVADLGLPAPDLEHLRGVDNLFVQEEIARLQA